MKEVEHNFQIGEIVEVTKGRETGKYAIVIGFENDRLLIADGDKRKFDKPKKKNIRHVRSTGHISQEVLRAIKDTGKVTNAKMRYVIQDFLTNHLNKNDEEEMKGV
ncbi:RNA-binding protein [Tepidibacillus sp. LV47]|uniref:RNA-binding protein n=1 Tax=Tepidibacillus sp. LV47 TaxID=3398228 RepID=UPI003AB0AAF9